MYHSFSIGRPNLPISKSRQIFKQENGASSSITMKKLSEDSAGSVSEISLLKIRRKNIIINPVAQASRGVNSIKHLKVKKGIIS